MKSNMQSERTNTTVIGSKFLRSKCEVKHVIGTHKNCCDWFKHFEVKIWSQICNLRPQTLLWLV